MDRTFILASTSPRRRELLGQILSDFRIIGPELAEEKLDETLPLTDAIEKLALEKAHSVAERWPDALALGADTIVCKDNVVLGKPSSPQEAAQMLRQLSGAAHEVITAVALCCQTSGLALTHHAVSRVHFKDLTEEEIAAYIQTGEPLDKAGAYGIQGGGGAFVRQLEGPFDNVVGLPLAVVQALIDEAGGA